MCLKNIFGSEKFDDVILREFATLHTDLQDIYRHVAAMENAGVRVHRQLVIRMLGIDPASIQSILNGLEGIILEYEIYKRESVYGWRGRHPIITEIVAKYKYFDENQLLSLFETLIESISPTYEIEVRTIREFCTSDRGIRQISSLEDQKKLFRMVISHAPQERIPRHRLINNLIRLHAYDEADTEIRIFEQDFKADGAVARLKMKSGLERALNSPGIMEEDRVAILHNTYRKALVLLGRYKENKHFLFQFSDLSFEIFLKTGDYDPVDRSILALRAAMEDVGDPDIGTRLRSLETKLAGRRPAN